MAMKMDMPQMNMPEDMADSGTDSMLMSMPTYFTTTLPTSPLWFYGWRPTTIGTTFVACLGLFALTVVLKLLGVIRHQANLAWSMPSLQDKDAASTVPSLAKSETNTVVAEPPPQYRIHRRTPWNAKNELSRGLLAAVHIGLEYFLMLVVMSYNAYFFIAIVLGHFAGEVAFGRWSARGSHA